MLDGCSSTVLIYVQSSFKGCPCTEVPAPVAVPEPEAIGDDPAEELGLDCTGKVSAKHISKKWCMDETNPSPSSSSREL